MLVVPVVVVERDVATVSPPVPPHNPGVNLRKYVGNVGLHPCFIAGHKQCDVRQLVNLVNKIASMVNDGIVKFEQWSFLSFLYLAHVFV